ncbi:hypothetical protein BDR04DRAFT_1117804 [Suillus decipiens]|nr:hypothetical protein BDR04DRAFT_1117804 [Suillus decipiens]
MEVEEEVQPHCAKSKSSSFKSRSLTPAGSELGGRNVKLTLQSFASKVGILASLGHRALRIHVAMVNTFPSSLTKYEESWSSLVDTVEDVKSLKADLDKIKGNPELKECILNYIWSACTQIRGELVFKAHQKVPGSYSIPDSMNPQQVSETIQWMIKSCTVIYGGLNLVVAKTFDKKAPFSNPIFKDLFMSQWFSTKGEAVRHPDAFKHIPNTTLALIALVVESQVKFSEIQFRTRYQFYLNKLEHMQKKCPNWMK